jgi:hypothetical protein
MPDQEYDVADVFGTELPDGWKDKCRKVWTDLYAEFVHIRRKKGTSRWMEYHRGKTGWEPARNGGVTVCHIRDEAGHLLSSGFSLCLRCDQYDYEDGASRALDRALPPARVLQPAMTVCADPDAPSWVQEA